MKNKKFSLHNLLNNNKFILLISFLIAITIWVNVSPQREIVITCPITINTDKTSAKKLGLEVINGKNQNFSVSVEGKWYSISKLTPQDIDISYSFAGVTDAGKYKISVFATKANNTADFKILSISPETVTVTLDHIVTKEYTISPVYNDIKVADDTVYSIGEPIINEGVKTIQITGPAKSMDKIDRVVAEVTNEEVLTQTTVYKADLKFYSKKDTEVNTSNFTIPYDTVDITLPLNERKKVPIKATFINQPSGYEKTPISYTLSQKEVELVGTKEALAKVEYIELASIDFKQLTPKNFEFKEKLIMPSGITSLDGVSTVSVTVNIKDYTMKSFEISNFEIVNSNYSSTSVETKYKTVSVVGKADIIKSLAKSDLYIECDMSKASSNSGSVTLQGTVKSKKHNTVWGVGDCEVRIRVE